ncbi:TetR/AcrR family transcriptional regulator [Kribbella speibonae]|uniref:TetR family transcriptional regulator n=1 Tax=Kribbella speibonae TaxID=1572660 RepID=A0A4R0ITL6_9ACTN|nr:TetR family transcriptional regulator C-terminal domain-containing protein [Kribbella speibonae]TCC36467.1 TetR family transcriptional regulator [Kribbella speibonae]
MPKQVDAALRREEILAAAYRVLQDEGLAGISFRSVATRMGGSATLVTHYYASRQALVDDLVVFSLNRWREDLEALETGVNDPQKRLRILLEWLVPVSPEGLREERVRLNLLANHYHDSDTQAMLRQWDRHTRSVVRKHLQPLIAKENLEDAVEILTLTLDGISLSVVESPSAWPRRRQLKALEIQLSLLGLGGK